MNENNTLTGLEVAVIGMAGRFPGAANIAEFWENIKNGVESVSFFSEQELAEAGVSPEVYEQEHYVKSPGGILEGLDYFDAHFFGYTPVEAEAMDPQVRLFHQGAWDALEDAGYDPDAYEGLIGLFGGAEDNTEWKKKVLLSTRETAAEYSRLLLSNKDFVSARVSYKLNLKGPVYAIVTGCSTALTSIHLACRSLLGGECDMALAGGVYVHMPFNRGYLYQEGSYLSGDGHLRAFDANANGTVFSSGIGVVVLKGLEDALDAGDYIYAVIKGSAVNCDGNRKVNFTAPSVKGQAAVIKAAFQVAELEPESIGYLETHGTGTILGDPIEINALKQAFTAPPGWACPIGSVKTNIGHLDVAAGIAGFIKTVLAVKHGLIPPSVNYETPNPKLELENSGFYVNTELTAWPGTGSPRRAGLSSFGFGGTNAHMVLEEAPPPVIAENKQEREYHLILLSAKTPSALDKRTKALTGYFQRRPFNHDHENSLPPGPALADIAYTLHVGRQPFPYRKICVGSRVDEVSRALPSSPEGVSLEDPPVVFMFSGQGSQYVDMGVEIYRGEPVFREEMDRCFTILNSLTGKDFKEILYPGGDTADTAGAREKIDDVLNSGPVKLSFEYSLSKLLMAWGIRPHALMGHSFGEYTAACLAGVFSLEDALKLALLRGELMMRTPAGGMMSVPLPEAEVTRRLESYPGLSLAAVNSSSLCFVSGLLEDLDRLQGELEAGGVEAMRINFPRAAHSKIMAPITAEFADQVKTVTRREAEIPFISGLSGDWPAPGEVTEPGYWARHLEQPVQFARGLKKLLERSGAVFVQVGPDKGLPLFVNHHQGLKPGHLVLNMVKHKKEKTADLAYFLQQLGRLWLHGVRIHGPAFYAGERRHRVPLPGYPFEGSRYWLDVDPAAVVAEIAGRGRLVKRKEVGDWLYTPSWKRVSPVLPGDGASPDHSPVLIFCDAPGLGSRLARELQDQGRAVSQVKPGERFVEESPGCYRLNPAADNDYDALFQDLDRRHKMPGLLVHLWGVGGEPAPGLPLDSLEKTLESGFYSLLQVAQSLGRLGLEEAMRIEVVTDNMQAVIGEEVLYPAKAAVLGAVRVIPREYPHLTCHALDIMLPPPGSPAEDRFLGQLLGLLGRDALAGREPVMAWRGNHFWVPVFEPLRLKKTGPAAPRLREGGVYLITGGLGGIGFALAEYLARRVKAKLILTGRSALPARDQWQQWLDSHAAEDPVSRKLHKVMALEKSGAEVLVKAADAAAEEQVREVIAQATARFGPLNGLVHTAGIVDYAGVIQRRTREMTDKILAPKIKGTLILDHLTQNMNLDFFVICSSLASLFPVFGEVGYAAANIFIDAFAHYKNLAGPTFTTAVNWDTWQQVGAAVEAVKKKQGAGKTPTIQLKDGILSAEGVEVFGLILENPHPQVVVSSKDLELLLTQYHRPQEEGAPVEEIEKIEKGGVKRALRPRPGLSTPYVAPAHPVEQEMTKVWQEYFGIAGLGIRDDFFELGGDSLMATILAAKIHRRLDVRIPLTEIFQGPTIEQLSKYVRSREPEEFAPIRPVEKREYYRLSPAQKRLYFLHQIDSGNMSYNSPAFTLLEGELDKERLKQSLAKMIQRHESLRTFFTTREEVPVQRVQPVVEFELDYYTAREEEVSSIIRTFLRPFNLEYPPLLRVGLLKIEDDRFLFMIDMHHIITDGTSQEIFTHQCLALYRGRELPGAAVQYKDFSLWLHRRLDSGEIKNQEEYWLKEFAGEIPILDLPPDYPRPELQSFIGRKLLVSLSPEDTEGLNRLSRQQDVTLYMTTLAVFNVLLAGLSAQETVLVGTSSAGRQHHDLLPIIGMFVNTLVVKNHLPGNMTFQEFLRQIKEKTLAAFENQDYPFENLVEKLTLTRDLSRNPLFDVMFSFQNFEAPALDTGPAPAAAAAALGNQPYHYEDNTTKFDLSLFVMESGDTLWLTFEYSTKLFLQETMERFGNYFKQVVSIILRQPAIRLGKLELISAEEKDRLLVELNSTDVGYPGEMTIHALFERQVETTPDQVALVAPMGQIPNSKSQIPNKAVPFGQVSYGELNARAAGLAVLLQDKGVRPDTIVGIMVERSVEMLVGILGILKAGGAYMPIDPEYPPDRARFMLTDSSAKILVKKGSFFSNAARIKNLLTISLDDPPLFSSSPPAPLNSSAGRPGHHSSFITHHSSNLAYIIYTSGTTGKPKGVLIQHRNVVRLLFNDKNPFDFTHRDVWTLFHSYCFDFSVWEMYGALLLGGRLVVISREVARDPQRYLEVLKQEKVTVLNQTPSAFYHLMEEELKYPENALKLRWVIFGGEALHPVKLSQWKEKYPDLRLVNMYGITETTVHVTFKEITEIDIVIGRSSIGKPLPTLSAYVMNRDLTLVALGGAGEACIGGEGVARGYLNRPGLTGERFVLNPYRPAETIYRSGDLVRWVDSSGDLEYLGRIDDQVKIRGFRVELGEIESRLVEHDGIRGAVVMLKEDRLFAYIDAEKDLEATALREYLSERLPPYMVPAYFVTVDKIPLTSNGKTDRKSLAVLGTRLASSSSYAPPQNEIEKKITQVWKEILGVERVGIHDNYFELGGTSFDIIRINKRLAGLFEVEIPLVTMFRYTTVHSLGAYLNEQTGVLRDRSEALQRGKQDKLERLQRRRGI